ncbi:hypothetical protein BK816_06480 [Boudabousia tangfeifanii]|uniref:G5 domain-containing protein n=1 Tax=Boudabousia tangfeifanii TaxID=1912795 RepID=A0A1D9ML65_9ACTO|nr:resuscitation-promoting factor [Boudabousia tangfeifanii]AOZ72978.1 hypothetical protein BK816_06480 [Boudabousia tangfeifanii]
MSEFETPAVPATPENAASDAKATEEKPNRKKGIIIGAAAALLLAVGGGGAVAAASLHHSYKIDYEGKTITSSQWMGTVGDALEANDIKVTDKDTVSPDPGTKMTDNTEITVVKAKPYTVLVDGKPEEIWTTSKSAEDIFKTLESEGKQPQLVATATESAPELPLLDQVGQLDMIIGGQPQTVNLSAGATMADALDTAKVKLEPKDKATLRAENGKLKLQVTQVRTEERTETKPVDFETKEEKDDSLLRGTTKVAQEGKPGERTITIAETKVDGQVTESKEVKNEVTTQPVAKVVKVGTKVPPEPKKTYTAREERSNSKSSNKRSARKQQSSNNESRRAPKAAPAEKATPGSGVWAALARCESGGNPRAVSSNGLYHGLYQFTVSTWRSVGGSGLPSQASPAEQLKRAKILQARSGWGQWPACSRKIGVR